MLGKGKQIIEKCEREGIPYIVLSAADKCALEGLRCYFLECVDNDCSELYLIDISKIKQQFKNYRAEYSNKIKIPD